MEKVTCSICGNSLAKNGLHFTVVNGQQEKILCDYCFQEMSFFKKIELIKHGRIGLTK